MKNLLSLLITLGFILGIAACEPKPADETEDTEVIDEDAAEEEEEEDDILENEQVL